MCSTYKYPPCPVDPNRIRNIDLTDLNQGVQRTVEVNAVNHFKFSHGGIAIHRVAERLGGLYSKEGFQSAMIRLKQQGITASVFTPGTCVLVGCKTHMKAREAAQELLSTLVKEKLIPSDTLILNHYTENRVNSFNLKSPINLYLFYLDIERFYIAKQEDVSKKINYPCYEYNHENFEGFHWKFIIAGKLTTVMIFSSGKAVFTGTRDVDAIHSINSLFTYILTHYIKGEEYREMNQDELEGYKHYLKITEKKTKKSKNSIIDEITRQEEDERIKEYVLHLTSQLDEEEEKEEILTGDE